MRRCVQIGLLMAIGVVANAEPERFTFEHPSPAGEEARTFEARIDRPDEGANGYAVMLIGGGSVTDLDWTLPGSYEHEGETTRVTISGEPTTDAKTIGDALVDAGFVVMRWSSVHADDELAKAQPGMAMGVPFEYSIGLTGAALDAFRDRAPEANDKLILVGHSLGAPRATAVADDGVVGLVFLAGAYTSRTKEAPSSICERGAAYINPKDRDGDGRLSRRETPDRYIDLFDVIDADDDGFLCDWELSTLLRVVEKAPDDESEQLREGVPWPSDVIKERRMPTLALFGGLDPMSVHGGWLRDLAAEHDLNGVHVEYYAGLGHQLSVEFDGRSGPIDALVVATIVEWCEELTDRHRP